MKRTTSNPVVQVKPQRRFEPQSPELLHEIQAHREARGKLATVERLNKTLAQSYEARGVELVAAREAAADAQVQLGESVKHASQLRAQLDREAEAHEATRKELDTVRGELRAARKELKRVGEAKAAAVAKPKGEQLDLIGFALNQQLKTEAVEP
jgi:chromosome segregation ATPase